jgi:hypothetical protein
MSPIEVMFRQTLDVKRRALNSPAAVEDWNQPTYDADATVATLAGSVQPLTIREAALLSDAGAQVGDYHAFTPIADIRLSDRLRDTTSGQVFEVRHIRDAAGANHHLELLLSRVID